MLGKARLESLVPHAARLVDRPLAELVSEHPSRFDALSMHAAGLRLCFARQRVDAEAFEALLQLARQHGLDVALQRLFTGEVVNPTEQRPALHTALRGDPAGSGVSRSAHADALAARARLAALVDALRSGEIDDVINIGIGGSDLGPRLVVDALGARGGPRVHFLSNVDGHAVHRLLAGLDPARTAAIVVSKSFGTQETMANARIVRGWLGAGGPSRLYAVSANIDRAQAFGIDAHRVLPMWDWVGGRYSLWSSVGLAIALAVGNEGFEALLDGAAAMDRHVYDTPLERNAAVWHALFAVWNRNALGLDTQAVIPYDERLRLLPAYLQQLVMESLGKSVQLDGQPSALATSPVVWGGAGTDTQHSFFQALHQGTDSVPVDFIGVAEPDHDHAESHRMLLANLLAQGEALANGEPSDDPHRSYPGGRPSSVIVLQRLDPASLGALLALYEHSTYLQGVLWNINAFDQWGVELGKRLADGLLPALSGDSTAADPVTAGLLGWLKSSRD